MNIYSIEEFSADRLEVVMNNAFHANVFNGFDPSEFDVDAYEAKYGDDRELAVPMIDGYDVTELTEHRSPAVTTAFVDENNYEHDQFNSNAEADADVLASAGWGTDEDYGHYSDDF
jgi:hypothetical protein